jgi:hypothetical protein
MDSNNSAPKVPKVPIGSSFSAGMRTHTPTPSPTPAPALDKGKGKEVAPSPDSRSSTPRVDKGKAKEVTPANPFGPTSDSRRMPLTEEILSPEAAAAAQRRRDARTGMGSPQGGPFGSGNTNDLLSSLLGGMGDRNQGPPSSSSPMGPSGRPLGSPIQQTSRAPPPTGRAGGRLSGMVGLESLLAGLGGLGPGGGRLGKGEFDPGMFGPGSDKDEADGGNTGTGTEGGGDDMLRSGTWSGMGIQCKLSDDSA